MRTRKVISTLALAVWFVVLLLSLLILSKPGLAVLQEPGAKIEPGEQIAPRVIKKAPRPPKRRGKLLTRTAPSPSVVSEAQFA